MTTTDLQIKQDIVTALASCARGPLLAGATRLFAALGYESERRVDLDGVEDFVASFDRDSRMNASNTLLGDWKSVDMVFQLSGEELKQAHQLKMFETRGFNANTYKAFLFFAIDLREQSYTRTQLATITREVNKLFQMPVSVLFRHGNALTLAIVTHRPNKTDATRDVLEKVSLIKDVAFTGTHRAHVEILADLALSTLTAAETIAGFDDLQQAWKRALDSSELNRRFFRELANWYFWAVDRVEFPADTEPRRDVRNATGVIRLITRLMFVWFLREKRLVPDDLFDRARLGRLLRSLADDESTFYKAVLQNLFFATLNTEMRNPAAPRKFRNRSAAGVRDGNFMAHNLYRYEDLFRDPEAALALFADVPFLNGGLFECLDRTDEAGKSTRIDGFSDHPKNPLAVPNELFFSREHEVDLNAIYDTRGKHYKVRGLINILSSYKFTIAENTPIEEEVALDPELLGQVFENLLANYNPETQTTARKQTGSFYTPREIVNYMVDESLLAYLEQHLADASRLIAGVETRPDESVRERLQHLLAYTTEPPHFNDSETRALIVAIDNLTILDPASGSGAFPMGILHKLVHILSRLDPGNRRWKQRQIDRAQSIPDAVAREAAVDSIDEAFERNELDYGRKLFLIENCIYGVDIQPVAVQIAKLRCFIALIVDEKIDDSRENRGVRPLPNLETKFVAANALIGIQRSGQLTLRDTDIEDKEQELKTVRSRHFNARTPQTKAKWRRRDGELRQQLSALLRRDGFSGDTAAMLAGWDPYDQNASAPFFDPEWMFGVTGGFDVVIANPPYVLLQNANLAAIVQQRLSKDYYVAQYKTDMYHLFIELGMRLLSNSGILSYITPNTFLKNKYNNKLRELLVTRSQIRSIVLFYRRVFSDPSVDNLIFISRAGNFNRLESGNEIMIHEVRGDDVTHDLKAYRTYQQSRIIPNDYNFELENDKISYSILQKIEQSSKKFGEIGRAYFGIQTFDRKTFVSKNMLKKSFQPVIDGADVLRYYVKPSSQFVDYRKESVKSGGNADIYNRERIVVRQIGKYPEGSICKAGIYTLNTIYNLYITGNKFDIKYILGCLNSKIIQYYWLCKFYDNKETFPKIKKAPLESLPIKSVNHEAQLPIIMTVAQILAAKRTNPSADVAALEAEIDALVYALYELTEDEIKVVEEVTAKR